MDASSLFEMINLSYVPSLFDVDKTAVPTPVALINPLTVPASPGPYSVRVSVVLDHYYF